MKTDRELLELATKAAAYTWVYWHTELGCFYWRENPEKSRIWNPMEDDGDALRLVVRLKQLGKWVRPYIGRTLDGWDKDPYSAARRAIVLTAADIGEVMP